MAFPTLVGAPARTDGSVAGTIPAVNLPGGAAGNLWIALIRIHPTASIAITGFTQLLTTNADGADDQTSIFYRVCDGTEGSTVQASFGTSAKSGCLVWEIAGAVHPSTQLPEVSTVAVGTTLTPNPTAVTPTGGAKDYLWGCLVGMEGEEVFSAYPTNYTLGQENANSGTGGQPATNVRLAGAWRSGLNAASEDPGAMTFTGTPLFWTAWAMAIHPAPVPTITDVETTEAWTDPQAALTITGTNFEAAQSGLGRVELGSSATYVSATKVAQTVTSWGNTSIEFTSSMGSLTPGTLYLYVTNRSGMTSAPMTVTVTAPRRAQVSWLAFEVPEAAGGGVFDETVSESATAAESPTATLILPVTRSESATAAESVLPILLVNLTHGESAVATDAAVGNVGMLVTETATSLSTQTVVAVMGPLLSESATATDTTSGVLAGTEVTGWLPEGWAPDGWVPMGVAGVEVTGTVSDTAVATDAQSATQTHSTTRNDAASATETLTAAMSLVVTRDEAASASTLEVAVTGPIGVQSDTAAATDTIAATVGSPLTQTDTASAGTTQTTTQIHTAVQADPASAADAVVPFSNLAVSQTDTATAGEAATTVMTGLSPLIESATAAGSPTTTQLHAVTQTDSAVATETRSTAHVLSGVQTDAALASDAPAVLLSAVVIHAESATATDLTNAVTGPLGVVTETHAISASQTAGLAAINSHAESASATETVTAGQTFPVIQTDPATSSATQTAALTYGVSRSESAVATDSATAQVTTALLEAGGATDSLTAVVSSSASLTEAASATDSWAGFTVITFPLMVFPADASLAALVSTLDILTWEGIGDLAAGMSLARPLTCPADEALSAMDSTLDILTWEAESELTALSSEAR